LRFGARGGHRGEGYYGSPRADHGYPPR
jgi:hypothetical protein